MRWTMCRTGTQEAAVAGWVDDDDKQQRQHFIQQCINLGIRYPEGEGQFHAARVYDMQTNKSAYTLEQWTDFPHIPRSSPQQLPQIPITGTTPPPIHSMHFADVDKKPNHGNRRTNTIWHAPKST